MDYLKIIELINKLETEMIYVDGAMHHIKSHLKIDKDGKTIEEPIKATETVYTDLKDAVNIIHEIIKEYKKGENNA